MWKTNLTLIQNLTFRANGFPDNLTTYSAVSGLWASSLSLGLFVGPSVGGLLLDLSNFRVGSLYPLISAMFAVSLAIKRFLDWLSNTFTNFQLAFVIGFITQSRKRLKSTGTTTESANLLCNDASSSLVGEKMHGASNSYGSI